MDKLIEKYNKITFKQLISQYVGQRVEAVKALTYDEYMLLNSFVGDGLITIKHDTIITTEKYDILISYYEL